MAGLPDPDGILATPGHASLAPPNATPIRLIGVHSILAPVPRIDRDQGTSSNSRSVGMGMRNTLLRGRPVALAAARNRQGQAGYAPPVPPIAASSAVPAPANIRLTGNRSVEKLFRDTRPRTLALSQPPTPAPVPYGGDIPLTPVDGNSVSSSKLSQPGIATSPCVSQDALPEAERRVMITFTHSNERM